MYIIVFVLKFLIALWNCKFKTYTSRERSGRVARKVEVTHLLSCSWCKIRQYFPSSPAQIRKTQYLVIHTFLLFLLLNIHFWSIMFLPHCIADFFKITFRRHSGFEGNKRWSIYLVSFFLQTLQDVPFWNSDAQIITIWNIYHLFSLFISSLFFGKYVADLKNKSRCLLANEIKLWGRKKNSWVNSALQRDKSQSKRLNLCFFFFWKDSIKWH